MLLTKLETYKPRAIGLDIFKDVPVKPGEKQLAQVLRSNSNIIGIEKILPPNETLPPPSLPAEQVGWGWQKSTLFIAYTDSEYQ